MRGAMISAIATGIAALALLAVAVAPAAFDPTTARGRALQATPAPARDLAQAAVAAPPSPVVLALVRFTLAPGATFPNLTVSGPELISVEAGTLTVRLPGDAEDADEMAELLTRAATPPAVASPDPTMTEDGLFVFTLYPGDSFQAPSDTPHEFENTGPTPTVFLAAAVTPQPAQAATSSWPPDGSAGPLPAGIEVQPLDVGYARGTVAPSGVARFTLSRLAVAPGDAIPRHQAGGPELLSVEAGALALTVDGGEIAVRTSPTASVETVQSDESAPAAPIRLGANGAALIQPGTISTASNAGDDPLVVLRLTILPA